MADNFFKKNWFVIIAVIVVILFVSGYLRFGKETTPADTNTNNNGNQFAEPSTCEGDTPAITLSAVDSFTKSTSVGGTDYIKENGLAYTTATSNAYAPTKGNKIDYWNSNASYYCEPVSKTARCGPDQMQALCIKNATTVTIRVQNLDVSGTPDLTDGGGTYNVTLGASSTANLVLLYKGTSKEALFAMGGCVGIDTPTTIPTVTLAGTLSSLKPCPYEWTVAPVTNGNVLRKYEVPKGYDLAEIAKTLSSDFSLTSGTTNPSGTVNIVFRSANEYLGNDGNFYVGIEKDKNQDTTAVGSQKAFSFIVE
jgi:hypothetical protein